MTQQQFWMSPYSYEIHPIFMGEGDYVLIGLEV